MQLLINCRSHYVDPQLMVNLDVSGSRSAVKGEPISGINHA